MYLYLAISFGVIVLCRIFVRVCIYSNFSEVMPHRYAVYVWLVFYLRHCDKPMAIRQTRVEREEVQCVMLILLLEELFAHMHS